MFTDTEDSEKECDRASSSTRHQFPPLSPLVSQQRQFPPISVGSPIRQFPPLSPFTISKPAAPCAPPAPIALSTPVMTPQDGARNANQNFHQEMLASCRDLNIEAESFKGNSKITTTVLVNYTTITVLPQAAILVSQRFCLNLCDPAIIYRDFQISAILKFRKN